MSIVLMLLVFAVMLLGWLLAAIAFVASIVSMFSHALERSGTLRYDHGSRQGDSEAYDAEFLRNLGIQPWQDERSQSRSVESNEFDLETGKTDAKALERFGRG